MLVILLALFFVLIALVSGNNLSACTGAIIGSRITSKRMGIAIAIAGFVAGLALEGTFLKRGINALMPVENNLLLSEAFAIAIAIFLLAHRFRVPLSLTIVFTGMLAGFGFGMGMNVNALFIALIAAFWIVVPLVSLFTMKPLLHYFTRKLRKGHLWKRVSQIKLWLVIISFFTSFTLGANTLGLLFASVPFSYWYKLATAALAIIIGSIFLSEGELRRLGNEIVSIRYLNALLSQAVSALEVEAATLLGVPLSNTQTFTASLYGVGYSYKARLMQRKPAYVIVSIWLASVLLSFLVAFMLAKL